MNTVYNVDEELVKKIVSAQKEESLIFFIGAGVSISQGYPNWDGYISHLISYWAYNLDKLIISEESHYQDVFMTDINFLKTLDDIKMDNKRKVDLVNFIIRKYSRQSDPEKTEEIYLDNVLQFERKFFKDFLPLKVENDILKVLVQFNAAFITTNYDFQIEKAFSLSLEKNISYFDFLQTQIIPDTVTHIHGHVDSHHGHFVSSSKSYSQTYLNNIDNISKWKLLFEGKENPLMIFIGCSMEEEEILSIIDLCPGVNFYAIMQYQKPNGENKITNDNFNELIKQFYSDMYNIKIIHFGEKFDELPSYLGHLLDHVRNEDKFKIDGLNKKWKSSDQGIKEVIHTIEKYIDTKQYALVDLYFGIIQDVIYDNIEDFIDYLFQSALFLQDLILVSSEFSCFWELINSIFKDISHDHQQLIFEKIKDVNNWNAASMDSISSIVSKYLDNETSLNKPECIYKDFKQIINTGYITKTIINYDFHKLWLIVQIEQEIDTYHKHDLLDDLNFNLSKAEEEILKAVLETKPQSIFLSFKSLMRSGYVRFLYKIISQNKLQFSESASFPPFIYKNKLFQKIIINILIEPQVTDEFINHHLAQVIESIDFSDELNGKEMNEFIVKYAGDQHFSKTSDLPGSNDFYIDGIGDTIHYDVESVPYVKIDSLISKESIDNIIEKIASYANSSNFEYFSDSIIHPNLTGQNDEIIKYAKIRSHWLTDDELFQYFLLELVKFNLADYVEAISISLITALDFGLDISYLIKETLRYALSSVNFGLTYHLKLLIERALNDDKSIEIVSDIIFDDSIVNSVFSDFASKLPKSPIELNLLFNTTIGRYMLITEQLIDKNKDLKVESIMSKLHLLPADYVEYFNGRYQSDQRFNVTGIEGQYSLNAFTGFSHRYNMSVQPDNASVFSTSALQYFGSNYLDNFLTLNTSIILMNTIDPSIVTNQILNRREIFIQILNLTIDSYHIDFTYSVNWIDFFLNYDPENIVFLISTLIRKIDPFKLGKIKTLHNNFIRKSYGNFRFPDYRLEYILEERKYTIDEIEVIYSIVLSLINKGYININYSFMSFLRVFIDVCDLNDYSDIKSDLIKLHNKYSVEKYVPS